MTHRPEIREKLQKVDPTDHRHPEHRRRLALSTRAPRCRPLGHDLPDQRPPRRAERGDLSFRRRRSRTASATSSSRKTRTAAFVTCFKGAQARFRVRPRASSLSTARRCTTPRRSSPASSYLKQFMPEIKLGNRYSHYFYGHYYAAQAMWIRGGDDWATWYPAIRDELDPQAIHRLRRLLERQHLQRIRHGDGSDHPSDAEQLSPDLPTLTPAARRDC